MKKCFYIVATHNNKSYYTEGEFTDAEINSYVNNFDINSFLAEESVSEEFMGGPGEGHYAIYRQSSVPASEAIACGYAKVVDDTIVYDSANATDEEEMRYLALREQIELEIEQEFADNEPLVCMKKFA